MKQNKLVKSLLLVVVAMLVGGGQAYAKRDTQKAPQPTESGDQIPSQNQRLKTQHSARRLAAQRLKAQHEVAKVNELANQGNEQDRQRGKR